jgi:lysophospholipase L1-like esterase
LSCLPRGHLVAAAPVLKAPITPRLALIALIVMAGCGGHGVTVIPAPTMTVPSPPAIACPADISAQAHVGRLPTVNFNEPSEQDGQSPVSVTCSATSGSEFPIGNTVVTCEAADALSRKASCSFTVAVSDIPRIQKTRFMAFGDSITEGKIAVRATSPVQPNNYEQKLQLMLAARYELQAIVMIPEPESSEPTGEGKYRFEGAFLQAQPEVVTLLEGTNDLIGGQDALTITSAAEALQRMVQYARGRGARVFIATLPPMNGQLFNLRDAAPAVPVLNARIRSMAADGVTVVDLEKTVTLDLIGPDGKHPTPQGYQKIADTFFESIKAELEIKTPTLR